MPRPPHHPASPFNNLHPHGRKSTAVMGISISHMRNQSPGKSSRGTDLLSPLRLYQQHNERTGAGATQSKTPKKGSSVQFSSVPFSSAPEKQKKQKQRTRLHLRGDPPESGTGNGEKRHRRICLHHQAQDARQLRAPVDEAAQSLTPHSGYGRRTVATAAPPKSRAISGLGTLRRRAHLRKRLSHQESSSEALRKKPSHQEGSPGGPSCIVFGFLPRRPSEEHAVGQLDIQFQP